MIILVTEILMKPQPLRILPTKNWINSTKLNYNQQIIFNITITTAKEVSSNPKGKIQMGINCKETIKQNNNASKSSKSHLRSDLPILNKFSFLPKKTTGKYWPYDDKFVFWQFSMTWWSWHFSKHISRSLLYMLKDWYARNIELGNTFNTETNMF